VRIHDPPGDEEAEPATPSAIRQHPASERVEDQAALGRRDARPMIPDPHPGAVVCHLDDDADGRRLRLE
jgi:hypothetical protein